MEGMRFRREAKQKHTRRRGMCATRKGCEQRKKEQTTFRDVARGKARKAGRSNANFCHINSILWV